MPKYEFDNLGYILLNKNTNKLVFLMPTYEQENPYKEVLIASLNRTDLKNDYDLMQTLSNKVFYHNKQEISEELKNYNHTLTALKKGAQIEILKKDNDFKNQIVITMPSTIPTEEKWLVKYNFPEPTLKQVYSKHFTGDKYMNSFLKPAFHAAILKYDQEMAKKQQNPFYTTEQER